MSEIKINWQIIKDRPIEYVRESKPEQQSCKQRRTAKQQALNLFAQEVEFVTTLIDLEQQQIRHGREILKKKAGL